MRPFFGYNFGDYLQHWLSMKREGRHMPKIFHVNWFRKSNDGEGSYMWPGFGENIRVLEWVFKRIENEPDTCRKSPIGLIPSPESFDLDGLKLNCKFQDMFAIDKKFWIEEANEIKKYFEEFVNVSTPIVISMEIDKLIQRVNAMD